MTAADARVAPLRIIQVGTGGMGGTWLDTLSTSADIELVGLVDLNLEAARAAASRFGSNHLPVASSLTELTRSVRADAVVNVTVPQAHHPVTSEALFLGLPVLGEKPVAQTVAEAFSLAAASEVSGQLFMVSQSRRYDDNLHSLKRLVSGLGRVGIVSTEFFRAPRFGGFRDQMDFPLLLDMAIHPFDSMRFLLGSAPVSVFCDSYNPTWSWYRGDAAVAAIFELRDGTRFTYNASWCSPGLETSWNGRWRVSAEHGSAYWDGDNAPVAGDRPDDTDTGEKALDPEGIAGSLAAFVGAVRNGGMPDGEVHGNILSLAMVEAAVESATLGRRVLIDDVLERSLARAIDTEQNPRVKDTLTAWPSLAEAVRARGRDVRD